MENEIKNICRECGASMHVTVMIDETSKHVETIKEAAEYLDSHHQELINRACKVNAIYMYDADSSKRLYSVKYVLPISDMKVLVYSIIDDIYFIAEFYISADIDDIDSLCKVSVCGKYEDGKFTFNAYGCPGELSDGSPKSHYTFNIYNSIK